MATNNDSHYIATNEGGVGKSHVSINHCVYLIINDVVLYQSTASVHL